jgi:hypothetical protein
LDRVDIQLTGNYDEFMDDHPAGIPDTPGFLFAALAIPLMGRVALKKGGETSRSPLRSLVSDRFS